MTENIQPIPPTPWGSLTGVRPAKLFLKRLDEGFSEDEAAEYLQNKWGVSARRTELCRLVSRATRQVRGSLAERELGLYVGIPFCPSRCVYCSFVAQSMKSTMRLLEPFLDGLSDEIAYAGQLYRDSDLRIGSVYIGGGTPTVLSPAQLDRLLGDMENAFSLSGLEYTVEAGRPDTVSREKLAVLKSHGVTRVSVNPQSMDARVLAAIGRAHSPESVLEAYAMAREAGFVVNMDLIAGLPADTPAGFERTLAQIIGLSPENITVHTLSIKRGSRLNEEGSPYGTAAEVAQMLDFAASALSGAGYSPYYLYRQKNMSGGFENVGWQRDGNLCRYNVVIMEELRGILSLGGGGVTKAVDEKTGHIERMFNPKYPYEYNAGREKILAAKGKFFEFYEG